MIEWIPLVFNTIWITGLALILTAAGWQVSNRPAGSIKPLNIFNGLLNQKIFWWGWVATSTGLAGVSQAVWHQILWILFALISLAIAWRPMPVN